MPRLMVRLLNDTWLSVRRVFALAYSILSRQNEHSQLLSVILCSRHAFYGRLANFFGYPRHAHSNKFAYCEFSGYGGIIHLPSSRCRPDTEWDKWWQVCRPICKLNRLTGATTQSASKAAHTNHNQSIHPSSWLWGNSSISCLIQLVPRGHQIKCAARCNFASKLHFTAD